ncbi:MAG TPA: squalene/phytoene synthase family protein [Gaiellaceae bacterium]|nr:squalene/phytoene synthase family protein [Gaiellaceae bacterium]
MTVAAAHDHCRGLARAAGSSFYTGMLLLPPRRREAMFAIYALARRIDDIADGPGDADTKLRRLRELRGELGALERARDPVLVAVADVVRRHPVPLQAFHDLIDGAESDVRGVDYATFAELELYCRRVAGSIGRLTVGVLEPSDRARASALGDDLGVALQIGNILRDLRDDLANGRRYLPREDLERFGCSYTDAGIAGPAELLLAFEAQRGLGFLERGLQLLALLDRRGVACVSALAGGYGRLLRRIAARPTLPLERRPTLRPWEKTAVLAESLVRGAV